MRPWFPLWLLLDDYMYIYILIIQAEKDHLPHGRMSGTFQDRTPWWTDIPAWVPRCVYSPALPRLWFELKSFFTHFDSTNQSPLIGMAKTVGAVSANRIQAEEADQSQRQRWCDADAFLCQVWEALTVWPYVIEQRIYLTSLPLQVCSSNGLYCIYLRRFGRLWTGLPCSLEVSKFIASLLLSIYP